MKGNVETKLSQSLTKLRQKITHLLEQCESPIEQLLLLAFFEIHCLGGTGYTPYGGGLFDENRKPERLIWWEIRDSSGTQKAMRRRLELQYLIDDKTLFEHIKYRLDFALFAERSYEKGEVKIAIECDGHEFHEKTKEQAKRDKAKDRYLQSRGWIVARYTGSEIVKDAETIVSEIERLAEKKDEELYLASHPEILDDLKKKRE